MSRRMVNINRVHPTHVNGPDALIVEISGDDWMPARFGVTFDEADRLADFLRREVQRYRDLEVPADD